MKYRLPLLDVLCKSIVGLHLSISWACCDKNVFYAIYLLVNRSILDLLFLFLSSLFLLSQILEFFKAWSASRNSGTSHRVYLWLRSQSPEPHWGNGYNFMVFLSAQLTTSSPCVMCGPQGVFMWNMWPWVSPGGTHGPWCGSMWPLGSTHSTSLTFACKWVLKGRGLECAEKWLKALLLKACQAILRCFVIV